MSHLVSIIVLNYNGKQFLKGCFESIFKLDYPEIEVILADDCSSDGSVEYTREHFPQVRVLVNEKNSGACTSFNNAASQAKGVFIAKVDNDVIVKEDWLTELMAVITNDPLVGVAGSLIWHYGFDGVQDIGSGVDIFGYPVNYYTIYGLANGPRGNCDVFYVSGCSMLMRKDEFFKMGGFDEDYFIYKDDLDLCWRYRLAGYKVVTCLSSQMAHLSGQLEGGKTVLDECGRYHTTARKRYFGERNALRTILKNYSFWSLLMVLPCYFVLLFAEILFFSYKKQVDLVAAYFRAIWWNVINLKKTLLLRRQVLKLRQISDHVILQKMLPYNAKFYYFRLIKEPLLK